MDNKKPFVNSPKATPPIKSVAANAQEAAPAVSSVTEKVEAAPKISKEIERVDDIATVVKEKIVNTLSLNVRVAPKADAKVVSIITQGTKVNVSEEINGFAKIGDDRYVVAQYLK